MEAYRRLLEAHRRSRRRRRRSSGGAARSRCVSLRRLASTGGCSWRAAGGRSRPFRARRTRPERVVERAKPDLVARRGARPARTRRAPARRSSASTIGRSIRSIAAYSGLTSGCASFRPLRSTLHDDLRPRRSSASRCSRSIASQRTSPYRCRARRALEAGERRLVRRAARPDDEPAGGRRARRGGIGSRAAADNHPRRTRRVTRPRRRTATAAPGRARRRVADELERLARKLEPAARGLVLEHRPHCTRSVTSLRRRAFGGSRPAASGTVTRVPGGGARGAWRRARACRRRARRRAPGRNHDSTARSPRTPWIRPPPCASQTSRRPRPKRPPLPSLSGTTPSAPRRRSTVAASTPSPSSEQTSS